MVKVPGLLEFQLVAEPTGKGIEGTDCAAIYFTFCARTKRGTCEGMVKRFPPTQPAHPGLQVLRGGSPGSGPNPVGFWLDNDFWTTGSLSSGSPPGSPSWGPFGGRPTSGLRRPQSSGGFSHRPPPSHHFSSRPSHQRRRPPTKKLLVGDQHKCGVGQCEFFLFCWLGGGVVSGGCGGFLFACCQRPNTLGSEVYVKQVSPQKPAESKENQRIREEGKRADDPLPCQTDHRHSQMSDSRSVRVELSTAASSSLLDCTLSLKK